MTPDRDALGDRPARQDDSLSNGQTAFMLVTGPLAWFAQLSVGYALLSWPCYPYDQRFNVPLEGYQGTRAVALILLLICAALAAVSGLCAWRTLQAVKGEREGGQEHFVHVGYGRTRFIALWGTILGAGFGLTTLATLIGFALVPRCVG